MIPSLKRKIRIKKNVGIALAFFGMLLFVSPSLREIGVGVSILGVALYVVSKSSAKDRKTGGKVFSDQNTLRQRLTQQIFIIIVALGVLIAVLVYWTNHSPTIKRYRIRSYNAFAENELKITVMAQEAYYKNHRRYSSSIDTLVGDIYNVTLSPDVTIQVISADEHNYKMEAYHKDGDSKFLISGPNGIIEKVDR